MPDSSQSGGDPLKEANRRAKDDIRKHTARLSASSERLVAQRDELLKELKQTRQENQETRDALIQGRRLSLFARVALVLLILTQVAILIILIMILSGLTAVRVSRAGSPAGQGEAAVSTDTANGTDGSKARSPPGDNASDGHNSADDPRGQSRWLYCYCGRRFAAGEEVRFNLVSDQGHYLPDYQSMDAMLCEHWPGVQDNHEGGAWFVCQPSSGLEGPFGATFDGCLYVRQDLVQKYWDQENGRLGWAVVFPDWKKKIGLGVWPQAATPAPR